MRTLAQPAAIRSGLAGSHATALQARPLLAAATTHTFSPCLRSSEKRSNATCGPAADDSVKVITVSMVEGSVCDRFERWASVEAV